MSYNVNDITDHTILRLTSDESMDLPNLKLQKILYYIQAWYLVFNNKSLFDGEFQAWVHGPVNRNVYDRFKDSKYLYSSITSEDVIKKDIELQDEIKIHIDNVLDVYAKYSAIELEIMTHREDPWIEARKGYTPYQRCEVVISEPLMNKYYKSRIG